MKILEFFCPALREKNKFLTEQVAHLKQQVSDLQASREILRNENTRLSTQLAEWDTYAGRYGETFGMARPVTHPHGCACVSCFRRRKSRLLGSTARIFDGDPIHEKNKTATEVNARMEQEKLLEQLTAAAAPYTDEELKKLSPLWGADLD